MTRLSLFAPEIVQTSATDCGPACLAAFLHGRGIRIGYSELRDRCATDVDGTSIDVMEDLAVELGLSAEQVLIPHELVLEDERNRGSIAVVWTPGGQLHFVVLWNRIGPWIQVMDPARGRILLRKAELLGLLYRHEVAIPAAEWRDWAEHALLAPLERVLARMLAKERARSLAEEARRDPTWRTLAALDACVRAVEHLIETRALKAHEAGSCLLELLPRAAREADRARNIIPDRWWSVSPASSAGGEEQLLYRGAVLLRAPPTGDDGSEQPPEKADRGIHPTSVTLRLIARGNERRLAFLGAMSAVIAVGATLEAALFRASIEVVERLELDTHRAAAFAALIAFMVPLLAIRIPLDFGVLHLGRQAELRLRALFYSALPRIEDRYFQSRLVGDMAARAHAIQSIRALPRLLAHTLICTLELALACVGIHLLLPGYSAWIAASLAVAIVWPLITLPLLRAADLRMVTHAGALTRFLLDALMGLAPIRVHGGEHALLMEQEALLVEWSRAGLSLSKALLATEALRVVLSHALLLWMLLAIASRPDLLAGSLLLAYWTVRIPLVGEQLVQAIRSYPPLLNCVQRSLETISSAAPPEVEIEDRTIELSRARGVELRVEGVSVTAGGRKLLEEIDLHLAPGEQVGIVGRSGAGKSSLVGLFLGWNRPASGTIRVDGRALDEEELKALRRETAWVDPSVQLWNKTLLDNLSFGTDDRELDVAAAIEGAELRDVLETLERGFDTTLGENGARLSGGQGQRVRLARALLKRDARLVILDEPFRGLDRGARERLIRAARRWWKGATLLCVTHDVQDTLQLDRVLVIEDGRIVEDEAPHELVDQTDSRFHMLLRTELAVRRELWSADWWRRLRLDGGELSEVKRAPPDVTSDRAAKGPA